MDSELLKWALQQGGVTLVALAAIALLYVLGKEYVRETTDRRMCEAKRTDTVVNALLQQATSNDRLRTSIDRLIDIIDRTLQSDIRDAGNHR